MTGPALTLVLLSALAHPAWNFLLKRQANQELIVFWALVSAPVVLFPLGIFLSIRHPIEYPGWWFLLGTSLLHVAYFLFVARSYARADLSVAYPIGRGTGPTVVPILGVVALEETIAALAIAGIVAVFLGVFTVYWSGSASQIFRDPFRLFKESGTRYALGTGLTIAAYSVWDKVGVEHVSPLLYMYMMAMGSAIGLAPIILRAHGAQAMVSELRAHLSHIVVIGLLMFTAYGLVLTALEISRLSYVWPAREIGTVIGVVLGSWLLKEPFVGGRLIGSAMIAAGVVLIALAP